MRDGARCIAWLSVAGCTTCAAMCAGDVFLRHGAAGSSQAGSVEERTGYSAAVEVNDGKGQLKVSSLDADFDTAVATIRSTVFAGHEKQLAVGDGLAFGIIHGKDAVVRILLTQAGGKCVAFRLEQSPDEFAGSLRRTDSLKAKSLPSYPGSVPVFSTANSATDSVLDLSSANTDVSTAWNFMDSGLRRAGWKTLSAPGKQASAGTGEMGLYLRGREICCVIVRKSAEGTGSLIGLLVHQRKTRNGEKLNED